MRPVTTTVNYKLYITVHANKQQQQPNEVPIDRRNALRTFNHLESSIQTMEETKCFEKYRVLTDDADQLKKQLQVFTEDANQTNNQM